MPTARRRHQITETSPVEAAIELALERWPGETRSSALLRLIDVGARQLGQERDADLAARRGRLEALSREYGDFLSREELADLRQDWPA